MSVYKRPNSPYWYFDFSYKGRNYTGSTKTRNRSKAMRIEAHKREEVINQDLLGEKFSCTINEAIDLFLKTNKSRTGSTACNKLRGFILEPRSNKKKKIAGLPLSKQLIDLTTRDVMDLYDERVAAGYVAGTIKQELHVLKRIIDNASARGYKTPNIKYPVISTSKGRVRFLTKVEETKLLAECKKSKNKDLFDFVKLLLQLGVRHSELAALSFDDVNLERREVTVYRSKTNTEDVLPLTDKAVEIFTRRLKNRRDGEVYVFMNKRRTGHMSYSAVAFNEACDRAGLNTPEMVKRKGEKITFHSLRRTVGSRLAQNSMSLSEIGTYLGHVDESTTRIYAKLIKSDVMEKSRDVLNKIG